MVKEVSLRGLRNYISGSWGKFCTARVKLGCVVIKGFRVTSGKTQSLSPCHWLKKRNLSFEGEQINIKYLHFHHSLTVIITYKLLPLIYIIPFIRSFNNIWDLQSIPHNYGIKTNTNKNKKSVKANIY